MQFLMMMMKHYGPTSKNPATTLSESKSCGGIRPPSKWIQFQYQGPVRNKIESI